MHKIKINTYGEGIEIRRLHLDPSLYASWSEIAEKRKKPLPEMLLDPFFYFRLKHKEIQQMSDIEATVVSGMLHGDKSRLEIWLNRKKVMRFTADELFNPLVIFPIFNIREMSLFDSEQLPPGVYIIQKYVGLIRSEQLRIPHDQLLIEDFEFQVTPYHSQKFLSTVNYQNQPLTFVKSDAVISYQTAFEVI